MDKKYIVYTCITGGYDTLHEIKYLSPNIDYICFTDNLNLKSNTWKIIPLPNDIKLINSKVKQQRLIKILPHKYIPNASDYEASLWVDGNIEIVGDLNDFFLKYDISKKFLYVNKHPSRDCIYREQIAVIRYKKDTFENTNPQINRYRDEGFPEHYGLGETNILLRKHNDKCCIKTMDLWANELKNGSHRDQLSFNYAIWKTQCKDKIDYLCEKYYNIKITDNVFFSLVKHKRDMNYNIISDNNSQNIKINNDKINNSPVISNKEKEYPVVSIVIFTHNRTNVALETLKSLFKNLKYPNLNWIISDDMSTKEHLSEIDGLFKEYGIKYDLCQTEKPKVGLGASMNNGLKHAFEKSDIVLRTEDDWILQKELNLISFVNEIKSNKDVYGIRLGMIGNNVVSEPFENTKYKKIVGKDISSWIFVNQVMLVHKRTYANLGYYLENTSADKAEEEFRNRFNKISDNGKLKYVLFPNEIKWNTYDDESLYFIHIGRSTLGHSNYKEPKRYSWLYDLTKSKTINNTNNIISYNDIIENKHIHLNNENNKKEVKELKENNITLNLNKNILNKDDYSKDDGFDIVYVLGGASPHNNEELRYSLRSVEKFIKGVRNVFVVGKDPGFLSDKVIYVKTEDLFPGDHKNKDRNHWHNMEVICNDKRLSENFLFASDDTLVIKESKWEDFIPRHTGLATKKYLESPNSTKWSEVRKATLKRFPENQRFLWHPHMFSQMNKTKVLQCCKDSDYLNRNDVIIFSYYYNHYPSPKPILDFDTQEIHTAKTMDLSKRHVAHWEAAFCYEPFKKQLKQLFPSKSKYEAFDIKSNEAVMASIIVPCYNCEKYVADALNSIIGHNFVNYEIICIDDKSTDNSLNILEKYANRYSNIKLIKHDINKGLSISRNDALNIAVGKYVILLDSDDKFTDHAIDKIVENMEKNNLDIFYLRMKSFFDSPEAEKRYKRYEKYYKRPQLPFIMNGKNSIKYFYSKRYNSYASCENAFRREFLIDLGLKYTENSLYEDNYFNVYAALNAKYVFNTTDELYLRRVRSNSIVTEKKNFKHFISRLMVCRDFTKMLSNNKIDKNIFSLLFNYQIKIHFNEAEKIYNESLKDITVFNDIGNFDDSKKFLNVFNIIKNNKDNFEIYKKYLLYDFKVK